MPPAEADVQAARDLLNGIATHVREAIRDALMQHPECTNVRQDMGLIRFDVKVRGDAVLTRNVAWGLGRYADGKP